MKREERGPAAKQKPRTVQSRTTSHVTTARAFAHDFTPGDAVALALFVGIVALILVTFCAMLWLVAP